MKLWVKVAYVIIATARVAEFKSTECPEYSFKCANSERCIDKSLFCNGEYDCGPGDFSDEHCKNATTKCPTEEFQCRNGQACISLMFVCDHVKDCEDGSDEIEDVCSLKSCQGFQCHSGECILLEWSCDGANDCSDGSDEVACPKHALNPQNCKQTNHHFLCANGQKCITFESLCNGVQDCSDGSDENSKCNQDCPNCSFKCQKFPDGSRCICPPGFILQANNSCTDIDECQAGDHFGLCDQICVNYAGGYNCSCHPGFTFVDDRCKVDGGEGVLIFATGQQIRALYLESKIYHVIEDNVANPTAVAFDGLHVYYSTSVIGDEAIFKTTDIGGNPELHVQAGIGLIEDLVIDWLTKNLYFTDSSHRRLVVCSSDGLACKILFHSLDKPRGLALEPSSGLMFFTCWGEKPRIVKSFMDGTNDTDLVTNSIAWPNGIAIDFGTNRLFWADAKLATIEHINLDGSDRQTFHSEGISHPFSVDIFEDTLYWSDLHNFVILSCNKFTGKSFKKVASSNSHLLGIHIYHPHAIKSVENPCDKASCSGICLLRPGGVKGLQGTCSCPEGMELSISNRTCMLLSKKKDLIVGSGAYVYSVSMSAIGKVAVKEFPHIATHVEALTFDSVSGRLIVSDSAEGSIVLYGILSEKTEKVHLSNSRITQMDFDPKGNNLYYINSANHTIEVLDLTTLNNFVLMTNFAGEEPIDLALVYEEGLMFIAFWNEKEQAVHVDQFKMDGSHTSRTHLIESEIVGPRISLLFDHDLHRLYWSDVGTGKIKSCEKDGTIVHTIRDMPKDAPGDLALTGDRLFWSVIHSRDIFWENKFVNEEGVHPKRKRFDKFNTDHPIKLTVSTPNFEHVNHSCHDDNGNCSHLCISIGSKQACLCPDDLILGQDGRTCQKPTVCLSDEYQCSTGSCIRLELACDGKSDCPDGDDESHCSTIRCYSHMFACLNRKQCVDAYKRCDTHPDCTDGSDEEFCEHTCSPVQFQCTSGECIHIALRCDNNYNCVDRSDEDNCHHEPCDPQSYFRCNSGQCIPNGWECDGEVDCGDASDERTDCKSVTTCKNNEMHCSNGNCVDKKLLCNGEDDCEDGSDENDCPESHRNLVVECLPELFFCESHPLKCLPMTVRCNGTAECEQGEDEKDCANCGSDQFQCETTRKCINTAWVCDGVNDCGDHSDEKECKIKVLGKSDGDCDGVLCKDTNFCIPWGKVCDKHNDCHDGSDEGGHCGDGCEHAGCTDICQETPSGHRCLCPFGFNLMKDGRRCVDIDECSFHICSQLCNNTVGSYFCSCIEPYYHLKSDRTSCKARGPEMNYVYVTNQQIRLKPRSLKTVDLVFDSPIEMTIHGLDLDMRDRAVIWSSEVEGKISMALIDDSKDHNIISGLIKPGRLAYDWLTQNIYFVEKGYIVKMCNFNQKACSVIVEAAKDAVIDALTLDANKRVLFWSETHELLSRDPRSLVKKSKMSGEKAVTIIESNLKKVMAIVADSVNEVIYLADYIGGKVERALYDGGERKTIFREVTPIDMNLFEDHLYWLNKVKDSHTVSYLLQKCGVHGKDFLECEYIRLLPQSSTDKIQVFKLLQPALQRKGINDCDEARCEHLCAMENSGAICLCPRGERIHPGMACPNNTHPERDAFQFYVDTVDDTNVNTASNWLGWFLGIIFCVAAAAGLTVFFHYRATQKDIPVPNVHFHNPSYEIDGAYLDPRMETTLLPGQHRYENPIAFGVSQRMEGGCKTKTVLARRGYSFWSNIKHTLGLFNEKSKIQDSPLFND